MSNRDAADISYMEALANLEGAAKEFLQAATVWSKSTSNLQKLQETTPESATVSHQLSPDILDLYHALVKLTVDKK